MNSQIVIIVGQLEAGIGRHVVDFIKYSYNDVVLITDLGASDDFLIEEISSRNITIFDLSIKKSPSLIDIKNVFRIRWLLRGYKALKIIGHGAKGGLYARLMKLFYPQRVYAYYIPHGGVLHYSKQTFYGRIFFCIEYFLSFLTKKVFFESNYSKNEYFRKIKCLNESKFKIIFNGIDFKLIKKRHTPIKHLKICCVGQIRYLKGIDILLRALSLLKDSDIDFVCDIYGKGSGLYFEECEEFIKSQNLSKNINFLYTDKMFKIFKEYNVYVQPSRAESFGLAALEAYAANCNLILSNVGGLSENFHAISGVSFFKNGNHFELYEALKKIDFKTIPDCDESLLDNYEIKKSVSNYLAEIK